MNDSKEFSVVLGFELHTMYVLRRVTRARVETNRIGTDIFRTHPRTRNSELDDEAEARIA